MHKGDECALVNNSQPFQWKVLHRSGNEAIVPSVCFLVPPVNKEAVESVSRYINTTVTVDSFKQTLVFTAYQCCFGITDTVFV